MAFFQQQAGSPGVYDNSAKTLTISVGETARIILWGGGPPGQEKLAMATFKTGTGQLEFREDTKNAPSAVDRLFHVALTEAGEVHVNARVGSATGPDYSAPMHIIVLPKKAPTSGPEEIVMAPSDCIEPARRAANGAKPHPSIYFVEDFNDLVKHFRDFRDKGRKISKLQFVTHGASGFVGAGDGTAILTRNKIATMKAGGFHSIFSFNARVFFHGCNVAEDDDGVDFLKDFGTTFLRQGGGSVGASTSLGVSWQMGSVGTKIYHLWGDTVRVFIKPGGAIASIEGVPDRDFRMYPSMDK